MHPHIMGELTRMRIEDLHAQATRARLAKATRESERTGRKARPWVGAAVVKARSSVA